VSGRLEPEPNDHGGGEGLRRVVERARQGDAAALPELRRLLDESPELWRFYGDLARHAEESLVALAAGDNLLLRESLRRKLLELKASLAPNTPLERLLVDRVAACWVAANHADAAFAQARGLEGAREGQLRRRQDSAQRRLLESLKSLTTVRRLLGARSGQESRPGQPPGRDGSG